MVDDGDDDNDDDDFSGFPLGLTTSCAALGSSWVRLSLLMVELQQAIPYLPQLVTFYDMQENTVVELHLSQNSRGLPDKLCITSQQLQFLVYSAVTVLTISCSVGIGLTKYHSTGIDFCFHY